MTYLKELTDLFLLIFIFQFLLEGLMSSRSTKN